MRVIVIDFETFFDSKTYTLSKMGPIEYIRDHRFEVLCVGAQIDHNQTVVCPAENGLDVKFLKALKLDEPGTIVVGHNMAGFDALILSEHYGIKPWMILDTIPMMNWVGLSRIIRCSHKELTATLGHGIKKPGTVVSDGKHRKDFTDTEWEYFTDYCKDDVSQCAANFYSMLPYMKPDALKLISLTAKMATEPAFVPDIPMLQDYLAKLDAEQEQARLSLAHVLHYDTTAELLKAIRSPKIFPTLMEKVGGVCPMKWSDKKQCEIPATAKNDLDFVAMADDPNPDIALLVQTRLNLNSSIQKSRAESLVRKGAKAVPIMLATYKAHTGRYAAGSSEGSDKLNFQNLSKRDPSKLIIRQALKVPEGYKVVACDSSQVEARMLAWEAEQEDLIEQFRTGRDPYAEMASKIFHIDAQAIHDGAKHNEDPNHAKYKIYRNVGKTCVLSAGYGIGAKLFAQYLLRSNVHLSDDIEEHNALSKQAHAIYRKVNFKITQFWKLCDNILDHLCKDTTMGAHFTFGHADMFTAGWDCIPLTNERAAYIHLPNGFNIWYPNLHIGEDNFGGISKLYKRWEHGKLLDNRITGPKCVENITQSLAFHMLAWQACRMADAGISIKANIHDSFCTVVPDSKVEETKATMEKIMSSVPEWLEGFPVGCEAEVGTDFTVV